MKSTIERIHDLLQERSGLDAIAVAQALDLPATTAAARLSEMASRGLVSRKVGGRSAAGRQLYVYGPAPADSPVVAKFRAAPSAGRVRKPRAAAPVVSEAPAPVATPAPALAPVAAAPSLDALVDSLAAHITAQVMQRVHTRLAAMAAPYAEPQPPADPPSVDVSAALQTLTAPTTTQPAASKLPRVGVIGLLPNQCGVVATEFGSCMDLEFWNDANGDGRRQLEGLSKRCEIVFVHIRHTSHSVEELLKFHGANYRRVGGGVTALKEAMTEYFVNRKEAA